MDLGISGKTALVTGSSGGIGAAIARQLAGEGVRVVVHGRRADAADAVVASIGGTAVRVLGDLSTEEGARDVYGAAAAAVGPIDILVNNAGGNTVLVPFGRADAEIWDKALRSNLMSAVWLMQQALPAMRERGWGRIVNIGTVSAVRPTPMGPQYAAAKAALLNAGVAVAQSCGGSGVTVNMVSPGATRTAASEGFFRQFAKMQGWGDDWAEIEAKAVATVIANPCNRMGRVEDIADAVLFLAGVPAGGINGVHLRIDGGGLATIV